jgi:hypothetical protein
MHRAEEEEEDAGADVANGYRLDDPDDGFGTTNAESGEMAKDAENNTIVERCIFRSYSVA